MITRAYKDTGRIVKQAQNSTIPMSLRRLLRDKNQARKTYQRTGDPADRAERNRKQAIFRRALKSYEEEHWKEKYETRKTARYGRSSKGGKGLPAEFPH